MELKAEFQYVLQKHRQYLGPRYVEGLSLCDQRYGRLKHRCCHANAEESDHVRGVNGASISGWIPFSCFNLRLVVFKMLTLAVVVYWE